jgi:predicted DNA-binding transcriptional regulator AlpA
MSTAIASRLLTPPQVSAMLGIAVQTLAKARCTRSDYLPFIKLGRSIRYREDDVLAFIEAQRVRRNTSDEA